MHIIKTMIPYVDLHADTLTCTNAQVNFLENERLHISLKKLKKGGCKAQCFAIFTRSHEPNAYARAVAYAENFLRRKEMLEREKIVPILTIEDGGIFERIEDAERFFSFGVRICGFTWNHENSLGFPNGRKGGLKPLGKELLAFMTEKGILPDVSHLSDEGTEEVIAFSKRYGKSVVATHSLSRSVCDHPRNLSDGQIRGIADTGGVVGLCFVPSFVGNGGLKEHIRKILKVGGEDVLAIGSDFDGTNAPVIKNAGEMQKLFTLGKSVGLTARMIEKFAFRNAERVLKG